MFCIAVNLLEIFLFFAEWACVGWRVKSLQKTLRLHPDSKLGKFLKELDFGSAFVVGILAKNLQNDIIKKILLEIKIEYNCNRSLIERRLLGFSDE